MMAPSRRRRPLILWGAWLALLVATWAASWLWPWWHHGLAQWLQHLYGTPFATSPWYLRGNAPLHAFVALQATLCLVAGRRLLLPRHSDLWGIAAAVLICLADELAQACSSTRGFDPRDWASDAAGLVLAVLLLAIWGTLRPPADPDATGGR